MSHPLRYTLYFSARSPFARRIRVLLQKLTISYEPREINAFDPPADFTAVAPLGLVPVLVVDDGKEKVSLADSSAILEHLDRLSGGKVWPSDVGTQLKVRAASVLAVGMMENAVSWFMETQRQVPSKEYLEEYLGNIDRTLATIHTAPLRGMPWKISDLQMTQAGYDLIIALEYIQIRVQGLNWKLNYPELVRFLEMHRSRQDLAPTAPTL